ncbi:hypothetical protein C8T65DRAFT_254839 [Cerioporus squamosus]|nr:hypothetical protein C8T65DRAFT_254839 [Cerioporus squamosus]
MTGVEYEVESILRAKVEGGSRGRKSWSYWVKWKGYGIEENTWEPPKSFKGGSEHFIDHFWSRIDTNGRDYNNLRLFEVDEEFFPSGPPRRIKPKKNKVEEKRPSTPSVIELTDSEKETPNVEEEVEELPTKKGKRRRSSVGAAVEPTPPKRKRGRPPGIRPQDMETTERTLSSRRSAPNLRGESSRAREAAAAEPTVPSTSRRASPRKRGRPSKSAPQPSPSDDELLLSPQPKGKSRTPRNRKKEEHPDPAGDAMDVDEPSPFGEATLLGAEPAPDEIPEAPAAPEPGPPLPPHRVRAANPTVKVVEDPHLTETIGTPISVKAKFMARAAANGDASGDTSARVSSSKAGPGRSSSGLIVGGSRLTAQKGKLTVVKPRKPRPAKADVQTTINADQDLPDQPEVGLTGPLPAPPPPTGQELLQAAGADRDGAADLPDFEEDAEAETDAEVSQILRDSELDDSVVLEPAAPATPAPVLEARPLTFASHAPAAWHQSTIFGPLALGFNGTRSQNENRPQEPSSQPDSAKLTFNLNLDPAVSLPATLKDVHATQTFSAGLDSLARNPTGKFYKDEYAVALADTLRAQGSHARLALSDNANDEHKKHFERFISRLQAGEMFVQMNRAEILVMCASENQVLGKKLEFPAQLLGLGGTAVVAHVNIENHCEYADAAVHADNTRW